jgi:hypothetical protein
VCVGDGGVFGCDTCQEVEGWLVGGNGESGNGET